MESHDLWTWRHVPGAREELTERFLPLAGRLASRYRTRGESIDDLVQVASLGLIGAIDRFDPQFGISFNAFAIPTILGELKRHFRRTGWATHVPRGTQELALRVDRATRELTANTGRNPSVEALAIHLGIEVEAALLGVDAAAARYSRSLDAPAPKGEPDEPSTLADSLGVDDDRLGLIETALSLKTAIMRLPYLEREALTFRLEHNMKQADIAAQMGCSQMQVSRLLRRASSHLSAQLDPDLGA